MATVEPVDYVWMDGKLVAWNDATVHILTHSLHYGSGVFEGIRAYASSKGVGVFRLTDHIARLFRSAKVMQLDIPFSQEEIVRAVKETVRENKLQSGYIRPLVYLGYGEMGLNPLHAPVNVSIATWPWGSYLGDEGEKHGIRATISSWRRHDPNASPSAVKGTGSYMNSSLAKVDALKSGFDEAIMLNADGYVVEATGENVYVVRDGAITTPPTSSGALEGIRRKSVMALAREHHIDVREENIRRTDLYLADEVFMTGTAAEVVPVRSVDDREIGEPGPITRQLQDLMRQATRGELPAHVDWFEPVEA